MKKKKRERQQQQQITAATTTTTKRDRKVKCIKDTSEIYFLMSQMAKISKKKKKKIHINKYKIINVQRYTV